MDGQDIQDFLTMSTICEASRSIDHLGGLQDAVPAQIVGTRLDPTPTDQIDLAPEETLLTKGRACF